MINLDDLIAEAKSRMKGEINMPGRVFLSGVINALEAATREQGSAGDIRRAVRLWGERFIPGDRWDTEDARDLDAALKCVVEANPDRSRARVPVQGEPNGDRERIAAILQLRHPGNMYSTCERDADAILAAGFSRATVPDAATERVTENSVRHVKRLTTELQNKRESLNDQRREFRKLLAKARAERAAALAAIERVRGILNRDDFGDDWEHDEWVYRDAAEKQLADIEAALDGAPEPEWEWGYAGETLVGVHNSISREAAEEDVANLRRYWNDERKFWVVQRTPASEWLPVEGEGKP